jgi:hypothetical protein
MRLLLYGELPNTPPSVASDRTHRKGTRLKLIASRLRYPYFALFNIAGNGTVQFLYPSAERRDPPTVDPTKLFRLPDDLLVGAPFGADHAVAVAAGHPLNDLISELRELDGKRDAGAAMRSLERVSAAPDVLIGMQGIFTREK